MTTLLKCHSMSKTAKDFVLWKCRSRLSSVPVLVAHLHPTVFPRTALSHLSRLRLGRRNPASSTLCKCQLILFVLKSASLPSGQRESAACEKGWLERYQSLGTASTDQSNLQSNAILSRNSRLGFGPEVPEPVTGILATAVCARV